MKLDDSDTRILAALGPLPARVDALAGRLADPPPVLRERLAALAENGLVYDLGDGRYQRTESGRRVLARSAGRRDERLDTTPAVERAIASVARSREAADAVRSAYAFLRYWGRATADEIVDAVYSEHPAGYDAAADWWTACVRDALSGLPDVEPPARAGDEWRYAGQPEVTTPLSDGTGPLARRGRPVYGSAKHAVESLPLSTAERAAVRAAFGVLRRAGEASEADVAAAVYPTHPAGYASAVAWWDGFLGAALAAIPGVRRVRGRRWRYVQSTGRTQTGRREPGRPDATARGHGRADDRRRVRHPR